MKYLPVAAQRCLSCIIIAMSFVPGKLLPVSVNFEAHDVLFVTDVVAYELLAFLARNAL